jgi:hypothetical protein
VNNKLGKIWIEVVTTYFKALSRHLLGGTEENNEESGSGWLD